jgi:hypothetical protein
MTGNAGIIHLFNYDQFLPNPIHYPAIVLPLHVADDIGGTVAK